MSIVSRQKKFVSKRRKALADPNLLYLLGERVGYVVVIGRYSPVIHHLPPASCPVVHRLSTDSAPSPYETQTVASRPYSKNRAPARPLRDLSAPAIGPCRHRIKIQPVFQPENDRAVR